MTFREGLIKGRSHIVFVAALISAFALVYVLEQLPGTRPSQDGIVRIADPLKDVRPLSLRTPQPLSDQEMGLARTAWRYFQNNINPDTGLANSANKFPSTTIWDTGSFLIGMVSANRLGLIDRAELDQRLSLALASLARIPLFDGVLPNKAYDTRSLAMVDYANKPSERGLGWSALDAARLIVALTLVSWTYPEHAAAAERVLARWDVRKLVADGRLAGGAVIDGKTTIVQEGRLGYEQYGGKAMALAGLDALGTRDTAELTRYPVVEGIVVPADNRQGGAGSPPIMVTSEPYLLDGLEFGFDARSAVFASQVFRAQEARFKTAGILTAVSEGHVNREPYFVYATIWGGEAPWAVLTLKGERFDSLRTLSTKAAFAWNALFGGDYGSKLVAEAAKLAAPDGGWMEGRFESDGTPNTTQTSNTNGIVLASLAFQAFGPLLQQSRHP